MWVKTIQDEDFVNYKKPSMFLITTKCSFKCEKECGMKVCQNSDLTKLENIYVNNNKIIARYLSNPITNSIVIGGLEPFDTFSDMYDFIELLRNEYQCKDDIVIYTGYYENEIKTQLDMLKWFGNIIIKFGRFKPNHKPHFDEVLGVNLISNNQYAEKIC